MSFEDKFAETMKEFDPGSGLKAEVMALYRTEVPQHRRFPAPLKYAVCFALVLAVLAGGALFQPLQPVREEGPQTSAFSPPATGFTVVVNAATTNGDRQEKLEPGHTFRLVDGGPIIGGQTSTWMSAKDKAGAVKINWESFFGFQLKCIGNSIDKVTYETNRGEFQNLVKMNAIQKLYYDTHRTLAGSLWEKTMRPAGGNLAYKPVGAAQTLDPDSDGVLHLKLTMSTDMTDAAEIEKFGNDMKSNKDMKFTMKYEKQMLDGTEIEITVFFQDGTRSTKTIRLSYPAGERYGEEKVAATIIN